MLKFNGISLKELLFNLTDVKNKVFNGVTVWTKNLLVFDNGSTPYYTGGWSVESGQEHIGSWWNSGGGLSVGSTISAGLVTSLGNADHEGIDATAWISSAAINMSTFNTITIKASNYIMDNAGACEVAYYVNDKLIKSFTAYDTSHAYTTFTGNISDITSGKIRIKLRMVDGSDYYSSDASFNIASILLS